MMDQDQWGTTEKVKLNSFVKIFRKLETSYKSLT